MARLAELPNIVGVKDATGNLGRVSAQRAACGPDFCQLSGNDDMALGFMAMGGAAASRSPPTSRPRCAPNSRRRARAATMRRRWRCRTGCFRSMTRCSPMPARGRPNTRSTGWAGWRRRPACRSRRRRRRRARGSTRRWHMRGLSDGPPARRDRHQGRRSSPRTARARYEYFIDDVFEAGIALAGTEVKALRQGEGSIAETYAEVKDGQIWLVNANIPEFSHGNRFNHEPKRPRKLLLHARQISKFNGAVTRQGMTLDPADDLFQRPRPGQGRARAGEGQEAPRQARDREGARLEARRGADHARARADRAGPASRRRPACRRRRRRAARADRHDRRAAARHGRCSTPRATATRPIPASTRPSAATAPAGGASSTSPSPADRAAARPGDRRCPHWRHRADRLPPPPRRPARRDRGRHHRPRAGRLGLRRADRGARHPRADPARTAGRAGDEDAGGRPARRRHRARFQQYPDRDPRPVRPAARAPRARRRRLRRHRPDPRRTPTAPPSSSASCSPFARQQTLRPQLLDVAAVIDGVAAAAAAADRSRRRSRRRARGRRRRPRRSRASSSRSWSTSRSTPATRWPGAGG